MSDTIEARARTVRLIFTIAILTGSFLLFLVQPMVARMALPRLGGAPAVWNSAMLVYQALLLAGYAYAHALGRVRLRVQAMIHVAVLLLAALTLPIGLRAMDLPPDAQPAVWVPWLFTASIGALFFAVSAQAPLLQRWFTHASGGRDPYALYAASNFGSFGGLIAYPLLAEPLLSLHGQSMAWTAGYILLIGLVVGCGLLLPRDAGSEPHVPHTSAPPTRGRVGMWILLAFVPSGLMLATSTFITTDIVAVPLLWVLPLGIYLLSFTIAFADDRRWVRLIDRFAPLIVLLFSAILIAGSQMLIFLNAFMALLLLFIVSVSLHGRMYALRPAADRVTGFYLAMSFGGALGGVFAGLIAPVLFDWTYEFPLLLLAAALLVPQVPLFRPVARFWRGSAQSVRIKSLAIMLAVAVVALIGVSDPLDLLGAKAPNYAYVIIALIGVLAIGRRAPYVAATLAAMLVFGGWHAIEESRAGDRTRSYFGIYTVQDTPRDRLLDHGTTVHGIQLKGPFQLLPTSYYAFGSGVGRAMSLVEPLYGTHARIGVVGLGTGTLACYFRPGQSWRFFEIDPAVVHIARDSGKFTFLRYCLPDPDIAIGDARLSLAREPAASRDLLVLDAFSSDAIPMHLLTREAFATYGRVVAPGGLLMVHISNRFLDLEPVVAAAAKEGGWRAIELYYRPNAIDPTASASQWIALSRNPRAVAALRALDRSWAPLVPRSGFSTWTDDYSTILPLLKWKR